MRPAAVLAIPLAFAFLFIGISQVSTLQDVSKPLTSGAVNELWGTTTFIMLLIAIVGLLTAVCSAMIWALRR
jgi:heme/copper-type cytochrome/quinol oxidase subunit 2